MKTAEELFKEYEILAPDEEENLTVETDCIDYDGFIDALKEHDKEIVEMIDERLKNLGRCDTDFDAGRLHALTELKNELEPE